jgi:putative transposase
VRHVDPSARVVRVMNQLVEVYRKPHAIRLDNGPELTADKFTNWAQDNKIKLLFIQPAKPNQNAFIARFNGSFREDVLNAWLFNAISEIEDPADVWVVDYDEYRPQESLGDVPPVLFKPRAFTAEASTSGLFA